MNKALDKYAELKAKGFEPRIPISVKAARTVYCYGFDPTLLTTYSQPNEIQDILIQAGWKVREIIIMNSRKSFKIVMSSALEAKKFIDSNSINIGGIELKKSNKESEIDPTVKQCWSCGILNPNHNNNNCPNSKHCLKCFSSQHKFYQCPLPRDSASMSSEEKESRYCIPCNNKGNHTSLDHRYCPTKREIIQERIRTAREQKDQEDKLKNRDTDLIKKTLKLSNLNTWPALQKIRTNIKKPPPLFY